MRLWHAWVGGGRFIVRAKTEQEAITLAREEAVEYNPTREEAMAHDAGADLLDPVGEAKVLDTDYS